MTTIRGSLLFALTLGLATCATAKQTLVGKWAGALTVQGIKVDMVMICGKDNTMSFVQTAKGQSSTQKGKFKEGKKSFTFTVTSLESASIPKATLDSANANMAKSPKTVTFNLEWKDDNNISISQQGSQPPLDAKIKLKRQLK